MEYILLPHNDEVIKPRALNTFQDGLAKLGVDKRLIKKKQDDFERFIRKGKSLSRLMMTPTVTTIVTKRKQLRRKVNPRAVTRKVTVSPTTKTSFKKSLQNHVTIVKIGMCLTLLW